LAGSGFTSIDIVFGASKLIGSFGQRIDRRLDWNLLKIGPKDSFVQTKHQTATVGTEGSVIIATSPSLIPPSTVDALILINRHIILLISLSYFHQIPSDYVPHFSSSGYMHRFDNEQTAERKNLRFPISLAGLRRNKVGFPSMPSETSFESSPLPLWIFSRFDLSIMNRINENHRGIPELGMGNILFLIMASLMLKI
jgi:hypothetical protein